MLSSNELKKGQIYYAEMPDAYGSEQGGFRPVLILQNNVGNKYSPTTQVAPLTSRKTKRKLPTHVFLEADRSKLKQDSTILVEQIRTIDKSRLRGYLSCVDESIMLEINTAISISFGLDLAVA